VALLPQEFPVAEEGAGGLFPPQNAAPLVIEFGEIPPGVDDIGVVLAEEGLAGGPDAFSWPVSLNRRSSSAWIFSQMA